MGRAGPCVNTQLPIHPERPNDGLEPGQEADMIEPGSAPPWQLRDVVRPGPLMGFARTH
jgi:hypothetical protein